MPKKNSALRADFAKKKLKRVFFWQTARSAEFFLGFFWKSGREAAGVFLGGNSGFLAEFGVKTVIFWGNLEIFEARELFFLFFWGEIGEADFGVFFWGNRQNL